MPAEMTGGKIVNVRGTVVTFQQKCENCGYVFDWNKTTIVPATAPAKYGLSRARMRELPGSRGPSLQKPYSAVSDPSGAARTVRRII